MTYYVWSVSIFHIYESMLSDKDNYLADTIDKPWLLDSLSAALRKLMRVVGMLKLQSIVLLF